MQVPQVQNDMWLPALATLAAFLANIPLSILLVRWHGAWGGALALSLARLMQLVVLVGG